MRRKSFGKNAFFAQIAQALPIAREIAGQEKHERILISSTGWNGPRLTLASLPAGPRPNRAAGEQASARKSGV
jgi:hypothetical protein